MAVQYSLGGVPTILVPNSVLEGSGICGEVNEESVPQSKGQLATSSALTELKRPASIILSLALFAVGLMVGA